ncbi:MAG: methyltransferase domain-containing protein [Hyphomicrobium sp.]|nr:methyltransferase domain-containing protein [Hyphomicrobium sp.]ODT29714.1 MAG: SAM-dependent methyltransferase [Hyphomicrobium sp. SCN 65-11]
MAQNIYDDPEFFAGYSRLPRSVGGLPSAPEWPRLQAMLPDVRGLRIVDLGCGFGWFCRWARENGAADVLGIDLSENMLARARAATPDDAITYQQHDLATVALPKGRFDLAYSSLAIHYLEDVARLFAEVHAALIPGGHFVFSTEHPILMASRRAEWLPHLDGAPTWPVDSYLAEGARTTEWFRPGVVKYHRTLATTLNALIGAGFAIAHVEEYGPTLEQIAAQPEWAKERERPMFLLVSARRN